MILRSQGVIGGAYRFARSIRVHAENVVVRHGTGQSLLRRYLNSSLSVDKTTEVS
jgi:hypothetical protein